MRIDNTIGPYDRIDRLNGIIKDQKSRIAELEAEVERLKAKERPCCFEIIKVTCTICKTEKSITIFDKDVSCSVCKRNNLIKQQSATDFEEGEG